MSNLLSTFIHKNYIQSFKGLDKEVWLLSVAMLINRSGMMVIPFLTLYLSQELGWDKFSTGVATSCFGLGSLTGSYVGGWLSDRIGTYRVMCYSLILGGIGFYFFLWVHSYYAVCLLIFLVSLVADAFRPAIFTAIESHSKDENLTRGISLIRMAINLGISVGPAVGGFLAAAYGYNWLFMIDGTTCVLAGIFIVIFYTPKIIHQKPVESTDNNSKATQSPYRDRNFLLFMLTNLVMLIAFFQILFSVPVYYREILLLEEYEIGWFFTANGLIIFFFEMPIIYALEKKGKIFRALSVGALLMGIGYIALWGVHSPLYSIIFFTVFVSVGEIINFPFISTVSMKRARPENRGKYMGATTVMFSLAFMISPLSGLPVIELIGYPVYWIIAGSTILISILGYSLLKHKLNPL